MQEWYVIKIILSKNLEFLNKTLDNSANLWYNIYTVEKKGNLIL